MATQRPASETRLLGPTVSIVIPTRNEAENIERLVARIEQATVGVSTEVIFVDDSADDTPAMVSEVSRHSRLPISLIHRPPERRSNGLGGAVVEGMRAARGQWVVVMDADLQHPPEVFSRLLDCAQRTGADIVVASRYAPSGDATGLGSARLVTSKLCTWAARILFPGRLRNVSDPLSGYFLVRRDSVDPEHLRPRGFKILLEILVRNPYLNVSQIPFRFGSRHSGQTKGTIREGLRYLTRLLELRFSGVTQRVTRFGLVGLSGLLVNQLLLAAFTGLGGLHYLLSAALATQGSTLWNFGLAEAWVFGDRASRQLRLRRLGQFLLVNNGTLLVRGPFLVILTSGFGVHYLLSNLITLLVLGLARYLIADGWIWPSALSRPHGKQFAYDIHGILRIVSEARLPELDYFSTSEPVERPNIRVRSRRSASPGDELPEAAENNHDHFGYQEGLGPLGFRVDVTRGEFTDVTVSPLVKLSPHVLYTNVVEPILRWTLVQKGYALVHGACACVDGRAALVTARTDTGKTTTILRLLTHHPLSFLSDDMVILRRDGQLLCYPKPLTISRHTLEAVNGAPLSLWERLALRVQSRVHSKSGRRTALMLARMPLPMASVNAVAQIVVPPPKYSIDRLIPGVATARKGRLTHLVVIEIGPDLEIPLDPPEAESTLLRNCEDAYGFPPYAQLAPFLYSWNGEDLRGIERDIISKALAGCPATLIRSQTRNWWERLPALMGGRASKRAAVSAPEVAREAMRDDAGSVSASAEKGLAARWEEKGPAQLL
jgi:glycosyltransferase involved in cell wall biosynthesis